MYCRDEYIGKVNFGKENYTQVFIKDEDVRTCRLQASLTRLRGTCELDFVAKRRNAVRIGQQLQKNQKPRPDGRGFSGAATQIRTGDLILTKDVLYQLSHSSISQECFLVTQTIITKIKNFVNTFAKFILGNLQISSFAMLSLLFGADL